MRYNGCVPTISPGAFDLFVFRRDGVRPVYLVLRRSPQVRYAGMWRMVAGKLEEGETAVQAAVRELKEETGLTPVRLWALDYLHTFYDPVHDRINLIPVLVAEVTASDIALSDEHDGSRWIAYEQALDLLRFPGQRTGLTHAHTEIVIAGDRGAPFAVGPRG